MKQSNAKLKGNKSARNAMKKCAYNVNILMIFGMAECGEIIKQGTIDDNRITKQTSQKTI